MSLKSIFWWLPFGSVPEISPIDLHEKMTGNPPPQILDVRTRKEWRDSRIEGAVNVPISSLRPKVESLDFDRDRLTVAICRSAHRSIPAVRLLRAAGFPDACQLAGGMRRWWKTGLPTVHGA
jgi:rhodanese-related sulfurtransferase